MNRFAWPVEGVTRVVVIAVGVILALLALLGAVAYFFPAGSAATLAPAAAALVLLGASIPALVVFAAARHVIGMSVSAALVVLLVVLAAPLYVASSAPADAEDVVVMTANLRLGQASADAVVREVREHRVDVFMAQEVTPQIRDELRAAGLEETLPHSMVVPGVDAVGTGLWSRYALSPVSTEPLVFRSMAARISIPGLTTRPTVMALHVAGPVPQAASWKHDYSRLGHVLGTLPRDAPVIVGGDFNATYAVTRYRALLDHGYADAGEQAGAGLLRTYPSDRFFPPLLGIDHILTRGGAVGRDAETVQISGSDHRALLVTIAVPKN